MGPNLFVHDENIAYVMPHATWYHTCNDIVHTSRGTCMQASWPPYVYMVRQELLMDVPFTQAERYL